MTGTHLNDSSGTHLNDSWMIVPVVFQLLMVFVADRLAYESSGRSYTVCTDYVVGPQRTCSPVPLILYTMRIQVKNNTKWLSFSLTAFDYWSFVYYCGFNTCVCVCGISVTFTHCGNLSYHIKISRSCFLLVQKVSSVGCTNSMLSSLPVPTQNSSVH